jgi:hypothetical protein
VDRDRIEHAGRGERPVAAGAIEARDLEAVGMLGADRAAEGHAEEEAGLGEIVPLGDERFREGQRLARPLRPGHRLAGTDEVAKAQLLQRDHAGTRASSSRPVAGPAAARW